LETYQISGLTFAYPARKKPALSDINLTVNPGDFIVLCGSSGCGKTTLLRLLKPSAAPHGTKSGVIYFEGTPLENLPPRDAAAKIGFVSQSVENQIVTDKVWHELAFGLESLGLPTEEIRLRVAEMANFFGIHTWFHRSVSELSGGQKQILTLASILVMQPSVLLVDEPTSQLDPIAARELLTTLSEVHQKLGVTIMMTEHRLEEVLPMASRMVVLEEGGIIADGKPREVGLWLKKQNSVMFVAMPAPMRVCDDGSITIREGAAWLARQNIIKKQGMFENTEKKATGLKLHDTSDLKLCDNSILNVHDNPALTIRDNPTLTLRNNPALTLRDVWFRYEKNQPDVLKGTSFVANYGEIVTILGGNGTGKTTALFLASGVYKPQRGKVFADKKVFLLCQNPQALFVGKTVTEDLHDISIDALELERVISLCKLENILDSHPYDISGGEQQRTALAKVLLMKPQILLLDEPTKGLDAEYKQTFAKILRQLADNGAAIVLVSHDIEFCAEYADRCALFFDGEILAENKARKFFNGNYFYTTGANRMARNIFPWVVTVGDIKQALGHIL
jgi:energy-coupling factor transport system ATP-binding protein